MKNLPPLITTLLFLLSIHGLQAQCPAQLQLKGVEHGLFVLEDLTPTDPNTHTDVIAFRQYSLILKNPLMNPKIIVALAQMSTLTSTIDLFDINIIAKTETQFVLGFIYEPLKWKKISYRYLINNRTDLNFQMITLSSVSFKASDNNFVIAETQLDQELKNFQKFQALSFIRGLKYKNNDLVDHSLAISIVSANLSSKTIAFNISGVTNSNKVELQLLSISYLYFDPKQATFASFGGLISRSNYVGKSQIDILHQDLPTNFYWLYGITNVDFTGKNFSVTSEITEDSFFNLETSLSAKRIEFTYFSLGGKAAQVCQNCPDKIISGTFCVKQCQSNQVYYFFKDGSKACQKCTGNLLPNVQRTKCVESGSIKVLQTISTQSTVQYQQNQAYTPFNPNQVSLSPTTDSKISTTTSSPSLETTNPSVSTKTESTISSEAQVNLPQVSEQSVTSSAMVQEFNYCNILEHLYWTGESCQCKVGYKLILGTCVSLIEIEESRKSQITGQTVPSQNPIHHGQPEQRSNIMAGDTPYVKEVPESSKNTTCASDLQVYDQETQHCECKQGLGFKANLVDDVLECVDCSKFSGYYLEDGRCEYCGENHLYDESKKKCECKEGFVHDQYLDCVVGINNSESEKVSKNVTPNSQQPVKTDTTTTTTTTTQTSTERTRIRDVMSLVPSEKTLIQTTQMTTGLSTNQTVSEPTTTTQTSTQTETTKTSTQSTPFQTTTTSSSETTIPNSSPNTQVPNPTSIPSATQAPAPTPAPSPTPSTQCMKLMKTPQINAANIYISLELSSERSFRSEDEMQNFLKQEFAQEFSKPSSVYCLQSDVALKEFDCLLLYPTGVPNSNFEIKFWYNDSLLTGGQCTLKVSVNPLESAAKSLRSLRRRSA